MQAIWNRVALPRLVLGPWSLVLGPDAGCCGPDAPPAIPARPAAVIPSQARRSRDPCPIVVCWVIGSPPLCPWSFVTLSRPLASRQGEGTVPAGHKQPRLGKSYQGRRTKD